MSAYEIASSISPSLAKKSIYANVNGEAWDINRPINADATLELKMKELPTDTKDYMYMIHPIYAPFFMYSFRKKRKMIF